MEYIICIIISVILLVLSIIFSKSIIGFLSLIMGALPMVMFGGFWLNKLRDEGKVKNYIFFKAYIGLPAFIYLIIAVIIFKIFM